MACLIHHLLGKKVFLSILLATSDTKYQPYLNNLFIDPKKNLVSILQYIFSQITWQLDSWMWEKTEKLHIFNSFTEV